VSLPFPESILHQHIATLGKTGAGKSSAMRDIAEHLLDKQKRICIVDPKGDWWGLKASADGKGPGYPIICFGDFKEARASDVPMNPQSGKEVAQLIATGNRPAILGFRGWMPGGMTRFWIDFASTLFNANQGELYVMIDEVHNFAPKGKIMDPDSGKCLHWTNRIMSEGRGLGLTFFIASQRAQKVHNDTLDNCETLVAMRVSHPAARQSVQDWIDGNGDPKVGKEVINTLASLARGEAWIWSPENEFGPKRIQFPMFQTFDSFAPPQLQKKVNQAGWSEVNLDQVREKLSAVIAEAEANDPRKLRERIAVLEREARTKPKPAAAPIESGKTDRAQLRKLKAALGIAMKLIVNITARGFEGENVDRDQITAAIEKATAEIVKRAEEGIDKRQKEFTRLKDQATQTLEKLKAIMDGEEIEVGVDVVRQDPIALHSATKLRTPPAPRPMVAPENGNGHLSGPQLQMLRQLAEFRAIGKPEVNLAWLAAALGTTARARGFEENLRTVRSNGYAIAAAGRAQITSTGLELAGDVSHAGPIQPKLKQLLSTPQAQIFDALDDMYPHEMALEQLAEKFGTTVRARGFEENIRFLRSNELISVSGGMAKRAEWIG
jgi:hypothetical protein